MIYFDSSATTKVDDKVIEEMVSYMKEKYYNLDSSYSNNIVKEIEKNKKILEKRLGLNKDNFLFTSGGAEANKIALYGILKKYKKGHFIISSIEHPSLFMNALELKNEGFEFDYVSVDEFGNVDIKELENLIREDTKLVSIIAVNNEIGTIQDLEKISKVIKNKNKEIIFHVDFVQGLNHIDLDFSKIDVDMLSISSHKIHGPKGIGALYVNSRVKLKELFSGENKYNKYLARTFPTELVIGFLRALAIYNKTDLIYVKSLKDYFISKLKKLDDIIINSPKNSVDNIINVSFIGVKSEIIQNYLSYNEIYISKGSACSSNKKDSHVLRALKIDNKRVESAIRISFSKENTKEEIDKFFEVITPFITEVRKMK